MEKSITKKAQKEFLKDQLSQNQVWAKRALLKIYNFQTEEEQESENTYFKNGVGFSGAHAEILSSFARQLETRGSLSEKQMALVFKIIPKYWKQILMISDLELLNDLIRGNQHSND